METAKHLESVLCMKGGNGDSSYVHNSSVQLKMVLAIKPVLEHSIYKNVRSVDNVFRIADLGCATGMNTLLSADTIVKAVKLTLMNQQPEFQVYFTDLPSNDFNTLFRTLPPLKATDEIITTTAHDEVKPPSTRSYLASAVSGSHYGRLSRGKPSISAIPPSICTGCHNVEDRNSPAWNSGHVYISSDKVAEAYYNQFRQDFASFLEARAEEILPGGCLFIALPARNSGDVKEQGRFGALALHLEAAFEELVNEGLIEKEKLDSFSIPLYGPSLAELQSIVETQKLFEIESMRLLARFPSYPLKEVGEGEEERYGRIVGNFYRSLFENLVATLLGSDEQMVDEIFTRIAKRAAAKYGEFLADVVDVAVTILIRKSH